jgi:hypothetical protein
VPTGKMGRLIRLMVSEAEGEVVKKEGLAEPVDCG